MVGLALITFGTLILDGFGTLFLDGAAYGAHT